MKIEQIIKENRGTIIDVRTPEEFMGGHVKGSINIPLQELEDRMDEIRKMNQPLVLCCASGGRSAVAKSMLSQKGVDCYNGGSWFEVNYYHSQLT